MLKDFVHTPGPWRHRMIFEDDGWVEIVPVKDEIIDVAQVRCKYPEWRANAALVAAAPELLTALEGFMRCAVRKNGEWVKCAPNDEDFEVAEKAIAKARRVNR